MDRALYWFERTLEHLNKAESTDARTERKQKSHLSNEIQLLCEMETCYVEQGKMGKVFWLNVISTIRAKDYFTQFNIDPDYPVDREAGFLGVYLNYLFDEAESDIMSVKNNRIEK